MESQDFFPIVSHRCKSGSFDRIERVYVGRAGVERSVEYREGTAIWLMGKTDELCMR